ncbi:MAG: S9 family peptidase [Candidatus Eremiobacteraeota bacterium]|nr:S9 family peptidase [Candidatus Eremiobacteraeota bacterium]
MKHTVFVPLALAGMLCAPLNAAAKTFGFDDFPKITGVSDATISPDGARIAFVVSHADYRADRNVRTLALYDLKSRTTRDLSFGRRGIASPAWSPDGTRLAFLAQRGEGKNVAEQLFVMDLRGGDPIAITTAKDGVEQFAWRPDGAVIAYVTADPSKDAKAIARHLDEFVVGDQAYTDIAAPTPNHIWLVDADGKNARRLTSGSWSLPTAEPPSSPASPLSWSPDGSTIAITQMPNAYDADGDRAVVSLVDARTGAVRRLTSHTHLESYPDYSPDGKYIDYWYPANGDPAGENDIFVAPASGGDGIDITASAINTNVQRAMWMPDSQSLLLAGHQGTDAALWLETVGGTARRLNLGGVQPVQAFWLDASVSKTGAIAFAGSEPNHPRELYYMPSTADKPQRLTTYNDAIAAYDLGKVQSVAWDFEGYREDGVVTYPPNYSPAKTYPLVLVIHGGPNSASITSFNAFSQSLAAKGWIVFEPNYRGSDNLGETYWHAIVDDSGAGPGRDVMAGIAYLQQTAKLPIDPKRIAVSGWSYGGYMTSWMIGHYHLWKAAVSGAAVNNLVDEYNLADNGVQDRFSIGGSPYVGKLMSHYIAQSPITYAWQITTPTLILSDTGDARVPIVQSYEMYHALKDRGTPVEFWAYPVAGHFPGDPVRAVDVYRRWANWIARYLK